MSAIDELVYIVETQKTVRTSVLASLLYRLEREKEVPGDYSREPFKMGKRYLNNSEKIDYYKMVAFNDFLERWRDNAKQYGWSAEVLKRIELASKMIDQAINQIMYGLDPSFVGRILSESKKYSVITMYHDQAMREFREVQLVDDVAVVNRDLFNEALLLMDTEVCLECNVEDGSFTGCKVFKLFIDQDIDVIQDSPPSGVCPFSRLKQEAV
ncbi:MAG: hypothetical protein HGA27_00345 [Peptococcaceae bacterium]|nr:hypothetical protein [Peptococcaceae bacterium]